MYSLRRKRDCCEKRNHTVTSVVVVMSSITRPGSVLDLPRAGIQLGVIVPLQGKGLFFPFCHSYVEVVIEF